MVSSVANTALTTEGALAVLYTLARLSEQARLTGNLWPLSLAVEAELQMPAWSSVALYVIQQYTACAHQESPTLQTDQRPSAFAKIAAMNNLGVLHESAGNYGEAMEQFVGASRLARQLTIHVAPDGSSPGQARLLERELIAFLSVNLAATRMLFTQAAVLASQQNASRSGMTDGNFGGIFMLEAAHVLATLRFPDERCPSILLYNAIRSVVRCLISSFCFFQTNATSPFP